MDNDITKEPEFQRTLQFYRIYRHVSSILLIIARLVVGKSYGRGWRLFYEYDVNNGTNNDY